MALLRPYLRDQKLETFSRDKTKTDHADQFSLGKHFLCTNVLTPSYAETKIERGIMKNRLQNSKLNSYTEGQRSPKQERQ